MLLISDDNKTMYIPAENNLNFSEIYFINLFYLF